MFASLDTNRLTYFLEDLLDFLVVAKQFTLGILSNFIELWLGQIIEVLCVLFLQFLYYFLVVIFSSFILGWTILSHSIDVQIFLYSFQILTKIIISSEKVISVC